MAAKVVSILKKVNRGLHRTDYAAGLPVNVIAMLDFNRKSSGHVESVCSALGVIRNIFHFLF